MSAESDVSATTLVAVVGWVGVAVGGDGDDNPEDGGVGALQAVMSPVRVRVMRLSLSDRIMVEFVESSMVSEVMGVLVVMKQAQSLLKKP